MRSEFRKLWDNRAPPQEHGTVDKFVGQPPNVGRLATMCKECLSIVFMNVRYISDTYKDRAYSFCTSLLVFLEGRAPYS